MASPPILSPSGTTGWNRTSYKAGFEDATYDEMTFTDAIADYGTRLLGGGVVRKHARASGSVLAQSDDGNSLTSSNIIASPVTLTPVHRYVKVAWSGAEKAQIDADLRGEAGGNIRMAMAEVLDSSGLVAVASCTKFLSQASADVSMWRRAVGNLMKNTNNKYGPGTLTGVFAAETYPDLMAIPEFTNAHVRGGSDFPNVKGIFTQGSGVDVRFSTVVYQDANGWHNVIFHKTAFVVGWNLDISVEETQDDLLYKLVAHANNGYAVQHDLRAFALRTTASAL